MATISQIESLVTDARFQELKYRQEKTNIFSIVGQTHTEHWHSSFISWLLDAHSSLRLGHFPLARLLMLYMIKKPECGFGLREIYKWNLDEVVFRTEKDASTGSKKRSIDVYGESDELIIVIENKVNARENYNNSDKGQTADYYEYVAKTRREGQLALFFFITADQRQSSYSDKYVHISYQEMYDHIISKCIEHPQVSDDGKYLLEQYASNLRETLFSSNKPMAMVNIEKCKALYEDYAEILIDIFDTVEREENYRESSDHRCIVYDHYREIFDEIFLSVDERFGRTPKNRIQRQIVTFTELYKKGGVKNGMLFTMKYNGELFFARTIVSKNSKCYLQLLNENKLPYMRDGKVEGIYESSSTAGVDAINRRREERGIAERVKTLRGTTYWINEDGLSIKDLIEKTMT